MPSVYFCRTIDNEKTVLIINNVYHIHLFHFNISNLNLKSILPFISNIQIYKIQLFSLWFYHEIRQSSKYPYEQEYKGENRKPKWKLIQIQSTNWVLHHGHTVIKHRPTEYSPKPKEPPGEKHHWNSDKNTEGNPHARKVTHCILKTYNNFFS